MKKSPNHKQSEEMALMDKLNFVLKTISNAYPTEAIDILKLYPKQRKIQLYHQRMGADLQSEHERYLVEKHFKCPVILFDYPAKYKAFYMV
jgi:asparaginyl-tRNA synthetase